MVQVPDLEKSEHANIQMHSPIINTRRHFNSMNLDIIPSLIVERFVTHGDSI